MVLPENFNSVEHYQSVLIKVHNRRVRQYFSDVDDLDISTPKGELKQACLIDDKDTMALIVSKQLFYEFEVRRGLEISQPFYSIPIQEIQAVRVYRPQIQLYFSQDYESLQEEQTRGVRGEISFRIMDETSETISKSKLTIFANRIKEKFGVGQGRLWDRGRNLATYKDVENGYELRIITDTKANAIELIKDVLYIQNHSYQSKYLKYHTNDDDSGAYPAVQPSKLILGKSVKRPIHRRICKVRFRYAASHIHGLNIPVSLYDKSNRFLDPLVS